MSSIEKFINKLDASKASRPAVQAEISGHPDTHDRQGNNVDPSGVQQKSGMVEINFTHLEKQGMLTPNPANNQMTEEYRAIKRPLLNNAFGNTAAHIPRGNLIMVSSSMPGEGKSFTAINLALSMASEMDRTVLLVEADVAKPSICKYLGIPDTGLGLTDYLENPSIGLSSVMLRTNVTKLSVMPAGHYRHNSTELLVSANMRTLMDELSNRYADRVVIFDSPPLLVTSESVALAELMGQIVLVVESGKTQQSFVKDALAKLNPEQVVGVLLNKHEGKSGSYGGYYGYGGYGGYGHGGDSA